MFAAHVWEIVPDKPRGREETWAAPSSRYSKLSNQLVQVHNTAHALVRQSHTVTAGARV